MTKKTYPEIQVVTDNTWYTLVAGEKLSAGFSLKFALTDFSPIVYDVAVGPVGEEQIVVRNRLADPAPGWTLDEQVERYSRMAIRARYRRPHTDKTGPEQLTFTVAAIMVG